MTTSPNLIDDEFDSSEVSSVTFTCSTALSTSIDSSRVVSSLVCSESSFEKCKNST